MHSIARFACTLSLLTLPFTALTTHAQTAGNNPPPYSEDMDGDWITNSHDLCPNEMGLVELHGCAPAFDDFDTDGVVDGLDQCSFSRPEPVDAEGCSMSDRMDDDFDGITNAGDQCPTEPGWSGGDRGCPPHQLEDYDLDGVINALDICPHDFGIKPLNGCPSDPFYMSYDADHDGVGNLEDHCPFSPPGAFTGPNGCAEDIGMEDADQDGITNRDDLCPISPPGHMVNQSGCTGTQDQQRQDADNDGIVNALDLCPDTWVDPFNPYPEQSVTLFGCRMGERDSDRDGLPDDIDQCPWEPGHRQLAGCRHPQQPMWDDTDFDGTPDRHDECPLSRSFSHQEPSSDGCQGDDRADFDSDGVINGVDLCPASPKGMLTDSQGCNDYDRLDLDQDGLNNGIDLCPRLAGTPRQNGCAHNPYDADEDGVENVRDHCPYSLRFGPVDERGCALDSQFADRDGDGVEDGLDKCSGTPPHQAIDPLSGCSRQQEVQLHDQDRDGVSDQFDFCPGTPSGIPVDDHGCELPWHEQEDKDGDRVLNHNDRCPNTPRGTAITHDGCEIFFEPRVTRSINRPFPKDRPDLELFVEDIPVEWGPFVPGQHQLEIEHFQPVPFHDFDAHSHGDFLHVHIPPHVQMRTLRIPLRVRIPGTDKVSNWFELVLGDSGAAASTSLIVNDPQVLEMTGISLSQAFLQLNPSWTNVRPDLELFRQFWDSQRSTSTLGLPFFCTGETNGFPIVCDRPETDAVFWDEFSLEMEMANYRLTAVVNRIDLHNNWQDCGEHRLVFALQNNFAGRMFINLEARLPNPMPGDIQGCRPVIEFWRDLATVSPEQQAQRLSHFFYGGTFGPPAIHPMHFVANTGQIRSLQFKGGDWLFKEHKLEEICNGGPCHYWVRTVSVKENPFGPLFDPQLAMSSNPMGAAAHDFQQWFPQHLEGLLINDPAKMHNRVDDRFNHGQSHASGPEVLENDYLAHFAGQHGSEFGMHLQMALQGKQNADGSPLMVEHILARATAMTCAGCHAPDSFLTNFRDQIGTLQLPDGTLLHQWPLSHDFVHINEAGALSPALQDVFLPGRAMIFGEILGEMQ